MTTARGRSPLALALAAGLVAAAGCTPRPRAPALTNDPVYHNDSEGLRLLAPEGWMMATRGQPPPGKDERERVLVGYRRLKSDPPASFEVSRADLPESADLVAHLTGRDKWRTAKPPEAVTVGGAAGRRISLIGRAGNEKLAKEVVAVRRGARTFFFTTVVAPSDATAREQARRAVGTVQWK